MVKYNLNDIKKTVKRPISFIPVLFIDPIAVRLLWLISNFTNLTPSMITLFGLVMGSFSCLFVTQDNLIFSCIFFEFYYILDCVDGKLARLKNRTSLFGDMLDHFGDLILFFSLSLSYIFLFFYNNYEWIYICLTTLFLFLITFNNFVSFYFKSKINLVENSDFSMESNDVSRIKLFLNSRGIYFRLDNTEAIHLMFFIGPLVLFFYPDFYILILIMALISLMVSILSMVIRNKKLILPND